MRRTAPQIIARMVNRIPHNIPQATYLYSTGVAHSYYLVCVTQLGVITANARCTVFSQTYIALVRVEVSNEDDGSIRGAASESDEDGSSPEDRSEACRPRASSSSSC